MALTISGFSFIHNMLEGGYPLIEAIGAVQPYVDEVVIVDMASTDGTREVLEYMNWGDTFITIIDGYWGNEAGETLRMAHNEHVRCQGDIILHFEADEVYDDSLLQKITNAIGQGLTDIAVYRLQLEQNFQRCRWYPELVHRVFPRLSHTRKEGHTTNRHDLAIAAPPEFGFLWDITNCFRDTWLKRIENQAHLWDKEPQYILTPLHTLHDSIWDGSRAKLRLQENHWTWKHTPFNIPDILRPLVGMTKYEPRVE